ESDLSDLLKTSMKSKDMEKVKAIRQLRSKVQETQNAPGFSGEVDDALYVKVIKSYVGSLKKGIGELESAGEKGAALRQQYQREIDLFSQWLPELAGEDETRKLVKEALTELGVTDPKQAGRVMGHLMKANKDRLDPGVTKRILSEELNA
ncbi:MAG: GatB/YqeY domain-containing protein, partial [Myxococcota bacterium]